VINADGKMLTSSQEVSPGTCSSILTTAQENSFQMLATPLLDMSSANAGIQAEDHLSSRQCHTARCASSRLLVKLNVPDDVTELPV